MYVMSRRSKTMREQNKTVTEQATQESDLQDHNGGELYLLAS